MRRAVALLAALPLLAAALTAPAQDAAETPRTAAAPMTAERMGQLIRRVDDEARLVNPNTWEFGVENHRVAVVFDMAADRMRIVIPIKHADELDADELTRVMQANFDSALDARYALARDILWGTFIHPLSPLTDEQFLIGLGQTVNVVATFGTTYSSGLLIFGGGDSADLQRHELIEKLKELGTTT